jgi:hypothetical protein
MRLVTGLLFPTPAPLRREHCSLCGQSESADCAWCRWKRERLWERLTPGQRAQDEREARRRAAETAARRSEEEARCARLRGLGRPIVVGLVACAKSKRPGLHAARDLYTGPLFRLSLAAAELHCDEVYVLSAEHGLLTLERVVADYDKSLHELDADSRRGWARWVGASLRLRFLEFDEVELQLYAGRDYTPDSNELPPSWRMIEPLRGLGIGRRLRSLKELVRSGEGRHV